ncbi:hypothetical protein THOM_2630 [Trachipleistophora hominis]|uniref:Uncharacterized protein n=1 Tax=Trachipleistophora hominis TaxID=72359 RepID=L7JT10_TRAHO|nr:hypothetical protein THOM_2630 [Trachipleistophora hominis]
MEYHPVTLEILRDYKNSPETDVSLEILTLIIDSKIFLDIDFIHKYILTYKKNIKNKKTAIKKLEHRIDAYFEHKVYKNIDDNIVCIERISAFASFVLPKNTCAILQLKNDSDISSLGLANRILRLIFVNRENAKRRLLSQLENDSQVLCPNILVNNEQRDGTEGIDKDVDKKRRNKNVTESICGLQTETKRDEELTTEDECFTKQKYLKMDVTAKKPKKTRTNEQEYKEMHGNGK